MLHRMEGDGAILSFDIGYALEPKKVFAPHGDEQLECFGKALPAQGGVEGQAEGFDVIVMSIDVVVMVVVLIFVGFIA